MCWQHSENTDKLENFRSLGHTRNMAILVVSSTGGDKAVISPQRICETLEPLDRALKSPRALWELQLFRLDYTCNVPGFDYDEYPDHR
jgi:hypothetical protein